MKALPTHLALALLLAAAPAPLRAQAAEAEVRGPVEAEVREVVEELFRRMKAGDADGMGALLHPEVRLVTTGVREGTHFARTTSAERWLEGVRGSTRVLDERLYDTEVRVSGGLATVWTHYELFVDGVLSHCGVDAIDLVRTDEGWRIVHLADTRTTEGCRSR